MNLSTYMQFNFSLISTLQWIMCKAYTHIHTFSLVCNYNVDCVAIELIHWYNIIMNEMRKNTIGNFKLAPNMANN